MAEEEKKGWEPGMLESVDRFADILVKHAKDADGFLLELGEEYGVRPESNAVQGMMKILTSIADGVCDEVRQATAG